jgi:hypothetical protein
MRRAGAGGRGWRFASQDTPHQSWEAVRRPPPGRGKRDGGCTRPKTHAETGICRRLCPSLIFSGRDLMERSTRCWACWDGTCCVLSPVGVCVPPPPPFQVQPGPWLDTGRRLGCHPAPLDIRSSLAFGWNAHWGCHGSLVQQCCSLSRFDGSFLAPAFCKAPPLTSTTLWAWNLMYTAQYPPSWPSRPGCFACKRPLCSCLPLPCNA